MTPRVPTPFGRGRLSQPARVIPFRRRRLLPRLRGSLGAYAVLALCGVGALGFVAGNDPSIRAMIPALNQTAGANNLRVQFSMCGSGARFTCVVDGDTIWLQGQNLRLRSFDTPEPYTDICGGNQEVALAKRASARLLGLLNDNAFTVETFGIDGTGKRTLATIRIAGRDVGDILIEEHLARRWPDGDEWWCRL